MSHIHIPDGIIPVSWWLTGHIVSFIIIMLLLKRMDNDNARQKIPLTGVAVAVMLIAMSIPIGIIPLHFSLAVLSGIIIDPGLGFLAVFAVNFILALMGHGGVTVVGLNTLVIGSEVLVGFYIFRQLIKKTSFSFSAFGAVFVALLVSLTLMVAIVGATAGLTESLPHQCDHEHEGSFYDALAGFHYLAFTGWSAVLLVLLLGIILEATVTALIVRFFSRVRPDIMHTYNSPTIKG